MSAAARLPWWACVLLALFSYFLLHALSRPPVLVTAKPVDMSGMVFRGLRYGVASAAQYFVPVLLVGGAIVSFFGRRKRSSLVLDMAQSEAADAVGAMSWQDFERKRPAIPS